MSEASRTKRVLQNSKMSLLLFLVQLIVGFLTRKIFLDYLGAEVLGLNTTLGNILGFLNLAELGIGSCISFFLYKPLQSNNRQEIQEILSLFGYLYRWVGLIILCSSILISFFFPFIFSNTDLGMGIVYFSFYSF